MSYDHFLFFFHARCTAFHYFNDDDDDDDDDDDHDDQGLF